MMNKIVMLTCLVLCPAILWASQDTVLNQLDEDGKKTGYWKVYADGGGLQYKGYFEKGKPVGKMIRYFEDGETVRIIQNFYDQTDSVDTQIFYGDGSVASKGVFVNQKREGTWVSFSYYSGKKVTEENYVNGVLHGDKKKYYENGRVHEVIHYNKGEKHGDWLQFFPDGSRKLKASYQRDKATGAYTSYYPNQRIHMKGHYADDLKVGIWYIYDQDGALVSDMEYRNGIPIDLDKLEQQEQEFFRKQEQKAKELKDPGDMLY